MEPFDIALIVAIAVITGAIGYYIGRTKTNHAAISSVLQQVHYWRFRYYQTLSDIQEMEEEREWFENWCRDDD